MVEKKKQTNKFGFHNVSKHNNTKAEETEERILKQKQHKKVDSYHFTFPIGWKSKLGKILASLNIFYLWTNVFLPKKEDLIIAIVTSGLNRGVYYQNP